MPEQPEEPTLLALARGARARIGASEGAAVRDSTGRSYAGATVRVGPLAVSALELAVLQAAAAGSGVLEAVLVVSDGDVDVTAARDLGGAGVPVLICAPDGAVRARQVT